MPQHAVLSNGAKLDIPDGTSPEEVRTRVNTANALIQSHAMSFIGGGKAIWDAANAVAGSAGRIAGAGVDNIPLAGKIDLGIGGLNALKAVASKYAPSLKSTPDLPTISGLTTQAIGAPPLSPDAPAPQRYIEGAITGALNPKAPLMSAVGTPLAIGGGDIGSSIASYYGGPDWSKAGQWFGGLLGGSSPELVKKGVSATASPQAPAISTAAQNIDAPLTYGNVAGPFGRAPSRRCSAPFPSSTFQSGGRSSKPAPRSRRASAERRKRSTRDRSAEARTRKRLAGG